MEDEILKIGLRRCIHSDQEVKSVPLEAWKVQEHLEGVA